jgi:hypothetical protein
MKRKRLSLARRERETKRHTKGGKRREDKEKEQLKKKIRIIVQNHEVCMHGIRLTCDLDHKYRDVLYLKSCVSPEGGWCQRGGKGH